ncbi:MAG: phosphopyruvate hydratase, partial [Candidatus Nealsonbacteria bacterium]
LIKEYPIAGIEDPFGEDEQQKWQALNGNLLVIGDDLTVTNTERINMVYKDNLCNGVIIKPNQIGTVSETIEAVKLAKSFNWKIIVSHRSGETMDDFISDLAVGVSADFIKSGAPFPKERMAKYNRLLEIEKEINY